MASWRRICGRCCSRGGVAGVGHPVTAAAGPEPSTPADHFAPAAGEQSSARLGAVRADQIEMPASGGPTVQLGLCCWPVPRDCPCLAFMAAAASGPRHPPLRHLHRRERESPIWGRWRVCWFTSTRGRTSQTRMESIRSATGLRGFRGEACARRLERSRAIRGVAVLCADRLYLSLIPAIIVAVLFHPVALFPCTFVALVSIATILPPAITVTPSSNKTVTGRTRRKAAGMPTRSSRRCQIRAR